jgi:hypothetical protein
MSFGERERNGGKGKREKEMAGKGTGIVYEGKVTEWLLFSKQCSQLLEPAIKFEL